MAHPPFSEVLSLLKKIQQEAQAHFGEGKVADYIPALANIEPNQFGMAIACVDGRVHAVGDAHAPFSLQSITKRFTFVLALKAVGDDLWARVGRDPSGAAFNSIVQLETEDGIPRNPFINAGALVVTDILTSRYAQRNCALLDALRRLADDGQDLTLKGQPDEQFITPEQARRVNALLLTCGTYDAAGDFAYRIGRPVKTGVGGGIVGVIPEVGTVAVWSPEFDEKGNSVVGAFALERLVQLTGWGYSPL